MLAAMTLAAAIMTEAVEALMSTERWRSRTRTRMLILPDK
jgi:hypothetical protein